MRTITGKELDKAILKSQDRTWDGMPISKLKVEDLMSDVDLKYQDDLKQVLKQKDYKKLEPVIKKLADEGIK